MKIRLKKGHLFPRWLGVSGITLYPYILVAMKNPTRSLIAHELVHIDQVRGLGYFRFYVSYVLYYWANRLSGMPDFNAYWEIPYEKSARLGEQNKIMLRRADEII